MAIQELEYTDYTVKEKRQYEYRVIAENEGGSSVPSAESIPAKAKPFKGYNSSIIISPICSPFSVSLMRCLADYYHYCSLLSGYFAAIHKKWNKQLLCVISYSFILLQQQFQYHYIL